MSAGNSRGNGDADRRTGEGRRDESQDRRGRDRRLKNRRKGDRREKRRRKINCSTCGEKLSQNGFCHQCKIRVVQIRKKS